MDGQISGPADTGPADTGPANTGPANTGPANTGPADTGPVNTGLADTGCASDQTWSWSKRPDFSWTSLVFIPIFKYLVSSVLHGNLLCRHLQIIFISTAVILPKLYDVYIVHNIELQC